MTFGSAWSKAGGRIVATALAGVSLLAINMALHARPANAQPVAAQPGGAVNVSVPAGSLESGLLSLGRQTNLRMLYPSNLTAGKRTAGVSGQMSPQQAVMQLLAGTGLRASFTSRNTVQVFDPTTPVAGGALPAGAIPLDAIDVQGAANPNSTMTPMPAYAGGQVATGGQVGMLGNRNVMNTPFSQTSYTKKLIEDQQARTVQDVLANDPSVLTTTSGARYGWEFDTIRGFRVFPWGGTRSLNGLPSMAPMFSPSMDFIERVEVFKGPSALVNGMAASNYGNIGGTINLVTKQAGDEPLTQLTTRYMSRAYFGAHVDIGRRFGDNKEFGVRFNGALDGGNTPLHPQSSNAGSAALNLDYRGERVRLSADIVHLAEEGNTAGNDINLGRTPTFVPKVPENGTAWVPSWAKTSPKTTLGIVRGEADLTDSITAYAAIGAQRFESRNYGVPTAPGLALLDPSGAYVIRPVNAHRANDVLSMQGGVRAKVETGPVNHALALNLTQVGHERFASTSTVGPTINLGTIYNPVYGSAPALAPAPPLLKATDITSSSVGIADTLSILNERIQFTAGIRYQKLDVDSFNATTGAQTSSYGTDAWTSAFGLIVKPWENVSLYANHIEGLEPGTVVTEAYANANQVLPAYVSKQREAGVKVDWGKVTTTLAAFQVAQPNAISVPTAGGGLPTLALNGQVINRGIELNAYGELFHGVRLLTGITFLDARQTKTANGTFDGERSDGTPAVRAVIGGEWDMPFIEGLTLSGRFTYTSDQVISNTRPDLKIPSWTQVDLGARHTFASPLNGKPIILRFNVDNVFDKAYWRSVQAADLFAGQPRTYRLSAKFNF